MLSLPSSLRFAAENESIVENRFTQGAHDCKEETVSLFYFGP